MYTKDKNHRITLRLNDEQFDFVRMNAEQLDVSPSEFLRMVINSSLFAWRKVTTSDKLKDAIQDVTYQTVTELKQKAQEGTGRENDKADINDIIQH